MTTPHHTTAGPEPGQARVGLLFPGDATDNNSWSGTPAGLARALSAQVGALIHVSTEPPPLVGGAIVNATALARLRRFGLISPVAALRQARWQGRVTPAMAAVRGRFAQRRLDGVGPLDAVVQIHAECPVHIESPLATYEDMTVVQALGHGYPEFEHMSASETQRRVALQRRAYQGAEACCVTTRWARDSVVGDYHVPPRRVHVVGVGANRACDDHDRDWATPRFLFVGVDWKRKNGEAVVRAFARVRPSHPDAELHVVGGHPPIHEEGVVPHGHLRRSRPADQQRLNEHYRRATCFVLPSRVEPSAVAYVEAGGWGLPSIATTVGGSADLVGPGGVLVDPSDDDQLVRAMSRLCEAGHAAALGRRAKEHARLFTWERVAARILSALGLPGFNEPPLFSP